MIISCPSCKKNFEINADLIPLEGRNLQCGSCLNVWFYKFKQDIPDLKDKDIKKNIHITDENTKAEKDIINKSSDIKKKDNENQKDKALVKYEKKTKLNITNFIGYFVVLILSFAALIIILDTFQDLLSKIFPNIELILFNFYEILIDIYLFIKDLFR